MAVVSPYPGQGLAQSIPGTARLRARGILGAEEGPSLLLAAGKRGPSSADLTSLKAGQIGEDGSLEQRVGCLLGKHCPREETVASR